VTPEWNPWTFSANFGVFSGYLTGTVDTQGNISGGGGTPGYFNLTKNYVFTPAQLKNAGKWMFTPIPATNGPDLPDQPNQGFSWP
jgi:hypothetical protein